MGAKYDTSVWTGLGITTAKMKWCHIDDWDDQKINTDPGGLTWTMCPSGSYINAVGGKTDWAIETTMLQRAAWGVSTTEWGDDTVASIWKPNSLESNWLPSTFHIYSDDGFHNACGNDPLASGMSNGDSYLEVLMPRNEFFRIVALNVQRRGSNDSPSLPVWTEFKIT